MPAASRPRLAHVDAMRPLKQVAVVSTHCMLFFAPAASALAGGALTVTHFARFAFLFLSSAMLVYAYPSLSRGQLGRFLRRRLVAVALPYVAWSALYFALEEARLPGVPSTLEPSPPPGTSLGSDLSHFGWLLLTGYYQLYYLLVLLELCVLYPAFSWLLRRARGHHGTLLVVSAALQVLLDSLVHWQLLPRYLEGYWATREVWNYQFFLVAGGLLAMHYREVDAWLRGHWRRVVLATLAALAVAESWYALALGALPALDGSSKSDPFTPVDVPLFLGISLCLYLVGIGLTSGRRTPRVRRWVESAAANAYGVYLSQVLFVIVLVLAGWQGLERAVPWPLVAAGAVVLVYSAGLVLTSLLARLPLAQVTAGRPRVRSWRPTDQPWVRGPGPGGPGSPGRPRAPRGPGGGSGSGEEPSPEAGVPELAGRVAAGRLPG